MRVKTWSMCVLARMDHAIINYISERSRQRAMRRQRNTGAAASSRKRTRLPRFASSTSASSRRRRRLSWNQNGCRIAILLIMTRILERRASMAQRHSERNAVSWHPVSMVLRDRYLVRLSQNSVVSQKMSILTIMIWRRKRRR